MVRFFFLLSAASIFSIGLLMIFSTSSADVLDQALEKSSHQALFKQLSYAIAGIAAARAVWSIGYQNLFRLSPLLLGVFTIFLLLTLIPGIGKVVNGSRRWLGAGGIYFQPSEFVKILLPLYVIERFFAIRCEAPTFWAFLKLVGFAAVPILLVMLEPNNGTAFVMLLSIGVLLFLMKVPMKFWAVPALTCLLVGGLFATQLPYVTARIKVYLNPELDIRGKGHQPHQAKIAAGSGGIFGKGPGNGWQKLSYLPEAQNDYIAAIYGEEFGFTGILFLIACYMTFAFFGFYIAHTSPDPGGYYLAGTLVFLITFQAFLNMGVVSGLLPTTGLNLPFFSQGGTSLIANMMAAGLILSVWDKSGVYEHA